MRASRHTLYICLLTLGLGAGDVLAAQLKPYQEEALNRMLAGVPAEQRGMVRSQLEPMLAMMNEAQVQMMVAQFEASQGGGEAAGMDAASDEPEPSDDAGSGDWGSAEADFNQAFDRYAAYAVRVSDRHDAMLKLWQDTENGIRDERQRAGIYGSSVDSVVRDTCGRELNEMPRMRSGMQGEMRELTLEQDRLGIRTLVETRASYGSLAAYARALGMTEQDEFVRKLAWMFEKPVTESEVLAGMNAARDSIAALIKSYHKERLAMESKTYPDAVDTGMGMESKQQDADLRSLADRARETAGTTCREAQTLFQRGKIALFEPVVAKVKPHFAQ